MIFGEGTLAETLRDRRVFVSGPYSSSPSLNTSDAIRVADKLVDLGAIPFVPHLYHFWDQMRRRHYEDWMRLTLAWLRQCEFLVRLPGESPGSNREVALARELGIPVAAVRLIALEGGETLEFFAPDDEADRAGVLRPPTI